MAAVSGASVQLTGSGLEGHCERLNINWQNDRVILEGQVRLKCIKDGQEVELTADRLSVKLTGANGTKILGEVIQPPPMPLPEAEEAPGSAK